MGGGREIGFDAAKMPLGSLKKETIMKAYAALQVGGRPPIRCHTRFGSLRGTACTQQLEKLRTFCTREEIVDDYNEWVPPHHGLGRGSDG